MTGRTKVAKGFHSRNETRLMIMARLDEATFREVTARAKRSKTSAAEQIRLLVKLGLEAMAA